jgi:hypothetical protein
MATIVYSTKMVETVEGVQIEMSPLKIKYLREFMDAFNNMKTAETENDSINIITECVRISMKQYYPSLSASTEDIEDNFDLPTVYSIADFAAGIKVREDSSDSVKEQAEQSLKSKADKEGVTWQSLDLAKLESEIFLLGIYKDYDELEKSLSMPELMSTLEVMRDLDYQEKKFLAAMQGVDLDKESGKDKGQKEWEDMKARVFSGGQSADADDVLSLQGPKAKQLGFGIGLGLDYEDDRDPSLML